MADMKKYLDYAGLQQFWALVKDYYSGTVAKADSSLQGISVFDGSAYSSASVENGIASIDLSSYAKASDVSAVLKFQGVLESKEDLPTEGARKGDVYIIGSSEYVCVEENPVKFEELGPVLDLSGYYTKEEVYNKSEVYSKEETYSKSEVYAKGEIDEKVVALEAKINEGGTGLEELKAKVEKNASDIVEANKAIAESSASLQSQIDTERVERIAGDKNVFDSFASVEDYKIRKLFNNIEVISASDLSSAIADAPNNAVVTIAQDMELPSRIVVQPGKTVSVEIPEGVTVKSTERFITVGTNGSEPSIVELVGGGVIDTGDSNSDALVFVAGGSKLIVDGVKLSNKTSDGLVIATNGLQTGTEIVIKGGEFEGEIYTPSQGKVTISGGKFTNDRAVLYCKSGELNISGGEFNMVGDICEGKWAHWNNGTVPAGGAVIVESCDYGGHAAPTVSITGGVFNPAAPVNDSYKNYDILVINYGDNQDAVMDGTTVPYQVAEVSGHRTVNGTTEPSDGWYYFNDENTSRVN